MIGLGATIVSRFEWVLYIFAAFLILTGIKMLLIKEKSHEVTDSALFLFLKRWLPITQEIHGHSFWVQLPDPVKPSRRKTYYTPLFVALCLIEFADIIFAVDSIPAIFAITTDAYIVYTSNIFAILGLRALFFAIHAILHRFEYLKYALALVLIFIGSKVFIADLLHLEKFPASVSLGVTVSLIFGGILLSLYKTKR
jgi:tellurite resistance protein TerC